MLMACGNNNVSLIRTPEQECFIDMAVYFFKINLAGA
jgi:hypothetical protein